ncbi:MAG: CoA transferase [Synergistetes bacterium]|nr:CoA transferase [Synergistota bacterium]MCX8127120.1 CoA transferase [Synergistota bacterium]MDW8191993.1 CoA transferase [Synergistota bacterium]
MLVGGKALEDIRVLDLTHVLAGPFCTMILADLGAEVIKIEPPDGDDSRQFGPFVKDSDGNQQSGYFISINRNKKSVCLNLKTEEGKEILRKLISISDVVVENFRPGTMEKMGFSYDKLKEIKPDIIYCSISGFGHDVPPGAQGKPAYDMVAQAYSGLMSITGPMGGPPCRVGTSVGDIVAGHQAAIAILAALWYRDRTGKGQRIDVSMVDGLVYILENAIVRYTLAGEIPTPLGTAHPTITPFQAFEAADEWIVIPVGNDSLWAKFCNAIGRPDLIDDPRFKTNPLRTKNRSELIPILQEEIRKKKASDWFKIFDEYGVPYSPVNTIDKVASDPVISYRKMIVEVEQPKIGRIRIVGSPFRLSETPGEVRMRAPQLGEHTEEVLKEVLGLKEEDLLVLKEKGVIK